MQSKFLLLPLLLAPALTACSDHDHSASGEFVSFTDDTLVVNTHGDPDAHIGANGGLRIGNDAVTVTPSQRELLKRYYKEAATVRDDGIATSNEGAALGVHAVGSAFGNLVAGTPDKIDHDMHTRDKVVEATTQRLCSDLMQLKATQGEVAAQLPAFRPYAVFGRELKFMGGEIDCDNTHRQPPEAPAPPAPPPPPKAPPPNPHVAAH